MGGVKGKPSRETQKGEEAPPPPEILPIDRVKAELRKLFPQAPHHMTGAEEHELFSSLRVLDELTPEDWLACRAWMICPERVRGRKLWPRDRSEFVSNAGQAVEAIRQGWKTGLRGWWNQQTGHPAKPAPPPPARDEGETLDLGPDALQFFKSAPGQPPSPKPPPSATIRPPVGGRPLAPTREIGA